MVLKWISSLDIDIREVFAKVDEPALEIYERKAEEFAACVGAREITILPSDKGVDCQMEKDSLTPMQQNSYSRCEDGSYNGDVKKMVLI